MIFTQNSSSDFLSLLQRCHTLFHSPQLTKRLVKGQEALQGFRVFFTENSFPPVQDLSVQCLGVLESPQPEESQGRIVVEAPRVSG